MKKSSSQKSVVLHCFTPLASLATFIIEFALAFYAIFKFNTSKFARFGILILFLLGIFQLSEYLVCKSSMPLIWAKIGFIAITFLPPAGLSMVAIAAKKNLWTAFGYIFAFVFSLAILFIPDIISSTTCPGKFVIFNTLETFNIFYEIYYFAYIIIALSVLFAEFGKNNSERGLYGWMIAGYGSFLVPTIIIYILSEVARVGTVSVMCGFAVLFAMILVFKILPSYHESTTK